MMKRNTVFCLTLAAIFMILATSGLVAAKAPPQKGDVFPSIMLPIPENPAHSRYLGLEGDGRFQIPQVEAQIVIIEIFSMYCPVCQREAPRVNALYEAIERNGLKEKIKLIGIGANNSPFEVEYFRDTYKVPFPLFHDGDMAIYNALGGAVRTPYFMALKRNEKGTCDIFFTQLGGFKKADKFLELIVKSSGLKVEVHHDK